MRVWKFGDHAAAVSIVAAAEGHRSCRRMLGVDRCRMSRFVTQVSEDDLLMAGCDFGCGPAADELARFLNARRIQAIVAKSFSADFENTAAHQAFALISNRDAVIAYENSEYAPADNCLTKFILEAGPDATRRVPEVEIDIENGRLLIDGTEFAFDLPAYQS